MTQLLFAGIGFVLWAISIILMYYSNFYSQITHSESTTGYLGYIAFMAVVYIGYKIYTIFIREYREIRLGLFSIIGMLLGHLLIVCGFYSGLPEVIQSPLMNGVNPSGIVLFLHIISLLLYPVVLVIITRSVGFTLMNALKILDWRQEDMRIRVPIEISLGFLMFSSILLILSYFFGYTLSSLIVTLVIMVIIGIPGSIETYRDALTRSIILKNHTTGNRFIENLNLKLLSVEFGFFFLSFLLSISLINALRPMPIGWDDLGVYMNFPKIMATSGHLLQGGGLYVWQLITGTGFLFSFNAAQAFFINQLGGILAVISIISALSYILEEKGKKSLLSIPILCGALFYAMPMTVFQQAKDMKLDPALMFFSVSAFLAFYSLWKKRETREHKIMIILAIAGLLTGFAFGVKVTTLMLLLGGLGIIAYRFLSFGGYLGFFFLFITIFTKFNLWAKLNVSIPTDPSLIQPFILITACAGVISILYAAFHSEQKIGALRQWIIGSIIFLLGFGVALTPWLIKNIQESQHLSIDGLLGGSGGITRYDFEQFHTPDELKAIKEKTENAITSSGQTQNEDLGRYFGYDTGINNYLKLPANLTFQKNQSGEFTEITYIFLALVPSLFLFVRSRRYIFAGISAVLLILMGLYYFIPGTSSYFTDFFDAIDLKNGLGYLLMLLMNLVYMAFVHYGIEETESNEKLKEVLMFMGIYGFIFMISAFGIVWYGIMIYFAFFLMIGLAANSFEKYSNEEELDENLMSIKLTLAAILFIFISVYFFRSTFPHTWNNLKSAYYNEYKYNVLTQDEAIFAYRSDYITPIATLNLKSVTQTLSEISKLPLSTDIKKLFVEKGNLLSVDDVHGLIMKLRSQNNVALRKDAKMIGNFLYAKILYPNIAEANTGGIYRIGTFMTYLINNNRLRYFDDSLVSSFSTYIYTPSPEETINRMKKMGLKYLLVDLNAATIDRDPRHDLTDRFEKLLLTMRAKNLRLVDTDNKCLELAIGEYGAGKLQDRDAFIDIAGTNYETYRSGAVIQRNQKLYNCHNYIISKLNGSGTLTPSLENLKGMIVSGGIAGDPQKLGQLLSSYAGQSWFALFEITEAPMISNQAITLPPNPLNTTQTGSLGSGSRR